MAPLVLVAGLSLYQQRADFTFRFRNLSNISNTLFLKFSYLQGKLRLSITLTCAQLLCLSDVKLLLLALLAAVASSDTLMFAAVLAKISDREKSRCYSTNCTHILPTIYCSVKLYTIFLFHLY